MAADEPAEVGVAPQGASCWPPVQCSPVGAHGRKRILYMGVGVYFYCIYFVEVSYFPASSYSKLLVQKY